MKFKRTVVLSIGLFTAIVFANCGSHQGNAKHYSGAFEGSEPFWSLEIDSNKYILVCNNKTVSGAFQFSQKSERGETIGFYDKNLYGVIDRSRNDNCDLAVTEKDSLPYNVYFSFENITYKGCGDFK